MNCKKLNAKELSYITGGKKKKGCVMYVLGKCSVWMK